MTLSSRPGLLLGLALLLSLTGCLPNIRADLALPNLPYRIDPDTVSTEYLSVPGFEAPGTPRQLNRSAYLRYFSATPTETVFLLVPGIYAGAANFDIIARQLVATRPGLEVWAVDPRSNALEDHSALRESLAAQDPSVAYRYYVTERGTPQGFSPVPPEAVPFMRRWGWGSISATSTSWSSAPVRRPKRSSWAATRWAQVWSASTRPIPLKGTGRGTP